ncbi:MAG TPA: DUF433 domain-containing protein [Anaerolineaceae bacterium]|nr:DUF433 domain-containing protein [Anaerolineaceae bacterium]
MSERYAVNLPVELKKEAEALAKQQCVSLNQFILWSVAEKVSALKAGMDDPNFPSITYRRGASGIPSPVLRGTGIRVQTVVIANRDWNESPAEIACQYDLSVSQIKEAISFYQTHQAEINLLIQSDSLLETSRNG